MREPQGTQKEGIGENQPPGNISTFSLETINARRGKTPSKKGTKKRTLVQGGGRSRLVTRLSIAGKRLLRERRGVRSSIIRKKRTSPARKKKAEVGKRKQSRACESDRTVTGCKAPRPVFEGEKTEKRNFNPGPGGRK